MNNECQHCHGTGRGIFGGPCSACQGRGEVGHIQGMVQFITILIVIAAVCYVAIHIGAHA